LDVHEREERIDFTLKTVQILFGRYAKLRSKRNKSSSSIGGTQKYI
jgi:hypothetical protein